MFLSAQQIADSRDHTLNNLLGLSAACLEAGQRFSELLSTAGRDALHHGSKHLALFGHGQLESMTQLPTTLWLEQSVRHSKLLDTAFGILGETQKTLLQTAEAQVRVFDEIAFATINRAARSSPWEGEIALTALRSTLENAEKALHEINVAAIESVGQAETVKQQVTESVTDKKTPRKKPVVADDISGEESA